MKMVTLPLLAAILALEAVAFQGRQRTCCPYASGNSGSTCSSVKDCVVSKSGGDLWSPSNGKCVVLLDSKRSNFPRTDCLSETFNPTSDEHDVETSGEAGNLLAAVSPYVLSTSGARYLPAVSVKVDYSRPWKGLRFRLTNTDVCKDSMEYCNPRCVHVERNGEPEPNSKFTYDCEAGFYPSETQMTATTSGNTYRFDICLDESRCGSYLFRMPEVEEIVDGEGLILVERESLLKRKKMVLHFPKENGDVGYEVGLIKHNSTFVETFPLSGNEKFFSAPIGGHLDVGIYRIVLLKNDEVETVVAQFELKHEKHPVRSTSIWVVIFLILSTLLSLIGYFRYVWVKKVKMVDLGEVDQNGNCKKVLVITDLESRHHVDVVLQFNQYLKDECGVSVVYFAMDPKTGISSQADGDPWKWAQEATNKVSDDSGHILIVGSPPKKMGLDIYKDFSDKQAYVSTQVLREMDAKGKVSVAMFSYSDITSLPSVIPDHLKDKRLIIPKNMNKLLCNIHGIKKRPICPCLPLAFIEPDVGSSDLRKSASGKEIIRLADNLKEKVNQHKEESMKLFSGDEAIPLNQVEFVKIQSKNEMVGRKGKGKKDAKEEEKGLQVKIESKMLSLESGELENRDPGDTTEG